MLDRTVSGSEASNNAGAHGLPSYGKREEALGFFEWQEIGPGRATTGEERGGKAA